MSDKAETNFFRKSRAALFVTAFALPLVACGNGSPTTTGLDSPAEPDMAVDQETPTPEITPDADPEDDVLGNSLPNEDPEALQEDVLGDDMPPANMPEEEPQ